MPVQTAFSNDPAIGYAGQVRKADSVSTMVSAEASANIQFGRAVAFKPSSTDDRQATLPTNAGDVVAGIVVKSDQYGIYPFGELDQTAGTGGLIPGAVLNVLRRGEILCVCEDGCTPGQRLWVRRTAAGDPEFLGGLNSADDSTDMIDCTSQGQWLTTASAGGLAWLSVDFTAKQVDAS